MRGTAIIDCSHTYYPMLDVTEHQKVFYDTNMNAFTIYTMFNE